MKRMFSVVIAGLLLFCACSAGVGDTVTVDLFGASEPTASDLSGGTVAVAVTVNEDFCGIEWQCSVSSSDSSLTVSVFRADTDYKTSVSSGAVREITLQGLRNDNLWEFRTLSAGDYVIVFSEASGVSLCFCALPSDEANGKTLTYRNGEVSAEGSVAASLILIAPTDPARTLLSAFAYPVAENG